MQMLRRVSLVIAVVFLAGCAAAAPKYIRVPAGECVVLLTKGDAVLSVGSSCAMERSYTR